MSTRLLKIFLVFTVAVFSSLVAFNNVTDYGSNFSFVQHVLSMDTTFPENKAMWRSINSQLAHHIAYICIILAELCIAVFCWAGTFKLWQNRSDAQSFNRAKNTALTGLVLGILLWFGGFMTIGGEWYLMWQSSVWNGQQASSQFINALGIILIFLNMNDE